VSVAETTNDYWAVVGDAACVVRDPREQLLISLVTEAGEYRAAGWYDSRI